MSTILLSKYLPDVSPLAYGCMGLGGEWHANSITKRDIVDANLVVDAALEIGINLFDHADIYSQGKAEHVFSEVLKSRPGLREDIYIQSKCGIRFNDEHGPKRYDFSKEWIRSSVHGTLSRLGTDYIDILFLHRPDPLMEVEEVAAALESLQKEGKIRHVAVSNMNAQQMAFLQQHLKTKIVSNQIEISLKVLHWLDQGVCAGDPKTLAINFAPGTIEYCQLNGIQIQAWGCLGQGVFSGRDLSDQSGHVRKTATLVEQIADSNSVSKEAVVLSWLMRHPAKVQPVIGTTNPGRIVNCAEYDRISLSRGQWYALYESARGQELP